MAKRVEITFLLDDDEPHEEFVDDLHDEVQTVVVNSTGMTRDITVNVVEGV
jgi:hypothetical protein